MNRLQLTLATAQCLGLYLVLASSQICLSSITSLFLQVTEIKGHISLQNEALFLSAKNL